MNYEQKLANKEIKLGSEILSKNYSTNDFILIEKMCLQLKSYLLYA